MATPGEELRHADGDDGQDQARRLEEAPDEDELDDRAERDAGDDRDREREEVGHARAEDQQYAERCGDAAEVALGEVDDAVGAVDERDAERDKGGEAADDQSLDQHAERRGPQQLKEEVEEDQGGERVGGAPNPRFLHYDLHSSCQQLAAPQSRLAGALSHQNALTSLM